ncbi:MAG: DUF2796 domain-containing protein [Sedimenticola sp.]|nr:DUF2796 domain-containing protein [Sedimenticola sp.]
MRYSTLAALLLVAAGSPALAQAETERQHAAHEHGAGQLNVALDQQTLLIELSMPAMNLVGFEHAATNESERQRLLSTVEQLNDGLHLFGPSREAQCSLLRVNVESELLGEDEHAERQSHEAGEHSTDHAADNHDEAHADFEVSYEFRCASPSRLESLSLGLFRVFPGTDHLQAQAITPAVQTGTTLSADSPVLKLK